MYKFYLALIGCFLMAACHSGRPKPVDAAMLTENEVRDFINRYDKAWAERDTVAMKEIMDDKYIYFSSTGNTTTKDNIISWFSPADKYKVDTAYRNEINIILNANTAIVSTHWAGNGTFGEEKFDDDQRCGLVVQKLNGKLKIISEHCVQIEKK
jgi:ketosteroid isomerase-like protein